MQRILWLGLPLEIPAEWQNNAVKWHGASRTGFEYSWWQCFLLFSAFGARVYSKKTSHRVTTRARKKL